MIPIDELVTSIESYKVAKEKLDTFAENNIIIKRFGGTENIANVKNEFDEMIKYLKDEYKLRTGEDYGD